VARRSRCRRRTAVVGSVKGRGTPFDGRKPMDMRSATIHTDYTVDTSGEKKDRKAACDRMFVDNPEWMK
jgi:hypothetical protein